MPGENTNSWAEYLGKLDARYERRPDLFVDIGHLSKIKWGEKASGKCVVVGAKGTGKTAISQYILTESESDDIIWRVDDRNPELSTRVTDLGEYPAEIEAVLRTIILSKLLNIVKDNREQFEKYASQAIGELDSNWERLTGHFKNFLGGLETVGPVSINWDNILGTESKSKFSNFDFDLYVKNLKTCFSEKRVLIIFDDIDDVFLGADKDSYTAFVEGLIRTARTINEDFAETVQFLVFMKYGIYRTFYENPRDYDKVKDYILTIDWADEDLERMLSCRIAKKLEIDEDINDWEIWGNVFSPDKKQSIENIQRYLFERCPSGPRDLIDFVNRAIERKGGLDLLLEDIKACEAGFSEDRITAIYEDYGYTYPKIHKLIKQCFTNREDRDITAIYSYKKFEKKVFEILTDNQLSEIFNDLDYFVWASTSDLIRIFYTIGFIGYRRTKEDCWKFVLDDPKGNGLVDADSVMIHKVFWKALGIQAEGS